MRAVLVPHSTIPDHQRGHSDGTPDAVIATLPELLPLVDSWLGAVGGSPSHGAGGEGHGTAAGRTTP
jgi:hypothetical protein